MRFPVGRILIALALIGVIVTGVAFYLENRTSPSLPAPNHPSENLVQPSPTPEGPLWSQLGIDTYWPELTPLFEEGKFAQKEAITNSGQELLIVSVSPDISLAETTTKYAAAIIPELESLFGINFIPATSDKPVAAVIYAPLSYLEGEPAGFGGGSWSAPFGKVYNFKVSAWDDKVSISVLISELSHAFPTCGGPLWWADGASAGYPCRKLYPVLLEKLNILEEEWRHVFGPSMDPSNPRYSTSPPPTPEEWLEQCRVPDVLDPELPPLVELEKGGVIPGSCSYYASHQGTALLYELEELIGEESMKEFFGYLCQNRPITNEKIIEAAVYVVPTHQKEAVEEMFRTYIFGK